MKTTTTKTRAPFLLSTIFYLLSTIFSPLLAFAEPQTIEIFTATDENLNFTTLADKLAEIANAIIPFLIGVAFVAIIWGILKYVRSAGDTEKVAEGRKVIIYGIIALFLMLSFWGFVMMIKNSLF